MAVRLDFPMDAWVVQFLCFQVLIGRELFWSLRHRNKRSGA